MTTEGDMLRTHAQIREVHDLLKKIITNQLPSNLNPVQMMTVVTMLGTLCWVLGHEGGGGMVTDIVADLNRMLAEFGYKDGRVPDAGSANPGLN